MKRPTSITQLHERLLKGEFSCAQLVDSYLSHIESQKELNAFITVSQEYAHEKAHRLDRMLQDNKEVLGDLPLFGVVFSLKDLFLTKGIRTTAASSLLRDYVPQYSATVVNRLEEAGAIIIGKTNADAWAHGASGENSDYGATKNPWNTEYVPGGSSSGSAVAVAANMSLAAMGTDTGGSIRQPAGFTNTVGFKPTYGAVPRYGVVAMASSLDSMGHFTHTVEDSEKIFAVTKGEDGRDGTVQNKEVVAKTTGLKIGIPKEYFAEGLDPEVEQIVKNAAEVFKSEGIELVPVSLPHTKYAISVYYIVMPAEVSSNLGRYDGVRYGQGRESFSAEAKRRIMLGSHVLSSGYYDAYYGKAMRVRSKIIEDFTNVFSEVDAILAPTSPTPPFKIGQKSNDPLSMYLADIYTVAANLSGIPGLALPGGFTKSGLPVGFQLLGNHFSEPTLFALGKLYQKLTDWHTKTPNA